MTREEWIIAGIACALLAGVIGWAWTEIVRFDEDFSTIFSDEKKRKNDDH